MASIIRVKRSTGTGAPSSLNFGELGLTVGVGTHGNKGGRLITAEQVKNMLSRLQVGAAKTLMERIMTGPRSE